MLGVGMSVKVIALLGTPLTVTTTLPVVAPAGTGTVMLVELQLVGVPAVPLNVTVLLPCVAPKFVPVIVTAVPSAAEVGFKLVIFGVARTVNATPLLATPLTVTTTLPVVAPAGTGTVMLVALQLDGVAVVPLNLTVLVPCVAPKFDPVIVIAVATGAVVGFRLVILGVPPTVKRTPLLATPPTVTTTFPVVVPAGTGTVMLVALQLDGAAVVPLNVTVLLPCVAPKLVPVMVIEALIGAEAGFRLVMLGVAKTVKLIPLLATPLTVTTTLPVVAPAGTGTVMLVALQLDGVAVVPLNLTVLVPCVAPKFNPVIVIAVATGAVVGFRLVMLGVPPTVKRTPLLATPPTVTTTFPVVAPAGTGTVMLVALQLDGVAAVPLNVTVLLPCVAPKLVPVIVIEALTGAEVGLRLVMLGVVKTVKATPLLATPPTVTTTFPVVAPAGTGTEMLVALQLDGVAAVPPNVTVLVPCVGPKLAPEIVIEVLIGAEVGLTLVMLGADRTVKVTPLLATPPTVTTTFPVVAPDGTGTTMLVALQFVGVPAVPLNVTTPWLVPKFVPVIVTEVPMAPDVGFKLEMLGVVVPPPPLELVLEHPEITERQTHSKLPRRSIGFRKFISLEAGAKDLSAQSHSHYNGHLRNLGATVH
jgi:hypothetical protein